MTARNVLARRCRVAMTVVTALAIISACGQPAASQTVCNEAACTSPRQTNAEPVVELRHNTQWGDILVTNQGFTLYRFANDAPGVSRCREGCSDRWPPLLLLQGQRLVAGPGLRSSDLGLIPGPHGGRQVTYRHVPLYVYGMDGSPGQTYGQYVYDEALWFVVTPSTQTPNQGPPSPAPTPSSSA